MWFSTLRDIMNDTHAVSNSAHSSMWYTPRGERVLKHIKNKLTFYNAPSCVNTLSPLFAYHRVLVHYFDTVVP